MQLPERARVVAIDVEASGLHRDDGARLSSVGLAWDGGSLGLAFDQGERDKFQTTQLSLMEAADPNLGKAEWEELLAWLAERRLVMHNAKYDLSMLATGTRHWEGRDLSEQLVWDTMVGAHELDPTEPQGLEELAQRMGMEGKTGLADIKSWLKSHKHKLWRYDLVPWDIVEGYVVHDAEMTWAIYEQQVERFGQGESDWLKMEREMQLLKTLYRMESRGVLYDSEASLQAAEVLQARLDEITEQIPFEPNVNAAKRYFFGELGLEPDRRTEKGAPSLDAEQAQKWATEGVQWATEWAQVAKLRQAISMWYQGYPEKIGLDGRLRTSYKQTKVRSGRMSVERVQLQAMPRGDKALEGVPGVRSLLKAPEGYELWSLDLSQAELRVAAQYSRCEKMLAMLAEGVDLHAHTAKRVMGAEEGSLTWKAQRDVAKRLNFASIFQVGAATFRATISKETGRVMRMAEAEDLVVQWRQEFPEFGRAYRTSERQAHTFQNVILLPDTKYECRSWFGERDQYETAWSRTVQGSLAEFFKLWMIETDRLVPGTMLLTVHDSILLEIDKEGASETVERVADLGATMATELFGVEMKVDSERWAD